MSALLLALLLAAPAAAVNADTQTPLSGEWRVRNDIASNVSEMTCTFTQKDKDLTGGCVTDQATVEVVGKVEDTSVSWVFKSVYEGNPITLTYKGSLGT